MKKPTKKAGKPPVTTAIARIVKAANALDRKVGRVKYPGETLLAPVDAGQILGDEANLGALGLVEIKLTVEEERVLSRPVDESIVRIKPSGQPYISHPDYTRWFNDAFGRLGWAIVPKAKPVTNGKTVMMPYILYIHGRAAAFAYGEQDYHEGNWEQTYGDAAEATVASALRRCAKRLGVGLELWDRPWINAYVATHCIRVPVVKTKRGQGGGKFRAFEWRRRVDDPLPNEIVGKKTAEGDDVDELLEREKPAAAQRRYAPAAAPSPADEKKISEGQVRRFWAIVRNSGRTDESVRTWLIERWKLESSEDIKRGDYDYIIKCIEGEGVLPMPGASRGER